ncbi:unnamed protein product [Calicophoron daubneyi]|uniref:Sulfhydryl oxidase n=1 Tax=Calicophoron daubneyi TaxID=300641 RepID=A0AAV2TZU3_CALDB
MSFRLGSFIFLSTALCMASAASMHYASPSVVPLTNSDFLGGTLLLPGRWVVIIHSQYCGACTGFEPHFAKLVSFIEHWKSAVNFGSVNCAEQESVGLCRRLGVEYVPNLRFYSDSGIQHSDDTCSTLSSTRNTTELLNLLVKCLKADLPQGVERTVSSGVNDSMVILDLWEKVVIGGLTPDTEIEDYKAKTVPPSGFVPKATPVYGADIFRSLTEMLFTDVSLVNTTIAGEDLDALKEFLHTLIKLLPASKYYRLMLRRLSVWLDQRDSVDGEIWASQLKRMQFPEFRGEYIGCLGSRPNLRGYPCGVWELFHALTVRHYQASDLLGIPLERDIVAHAMNRWIPRFFSCAICGFHLAAGSANIVHPGESVLPANRKPPPEFTYDPSVLKYLPPPPQSGRDEVLWLNGVHNHANLQLSGSPTDDPTAPKMVYPPRVLCPSCWSKDVNDTWVFAKTNHTREAVLDYLVKRYSATAWRVDNLPTKFFDPEGSSVNWWRVPVPYRRRFSPKFTRVIKTPAFLLPRS